MIVTPFPVLGTGTEADGRAKETASRAGRGMDGCRCGEQVVLRRPGYLFFTYPREVEAFTWVPRPAPLGIADGTSDGVSDVVTTTSRSPLTVLPIDDVGPRSTGGGRSTR